MEGRGVPAKEIQRTRVADRREIIPKCGNNVFSVDNPHNYLTAQEVRRRYPSDNGKFKDYKSTFDAI